MKRTVLSLAVSVALSWPLVSRARAEYRTQQTFGGHTVPSGVNFQGTIEETGALVTGSRFVIFRIYDAPSGGNMLWESSRYEVALKDGVFAVTLDIPTSVLTLSGPKYMEYEVGGPPALAPRELLRSVPYAKVAQAVVSTIDVRGNSLSVTTPLDLSVVLYISSVTGHVGVGTNSPNAELSLSSATANWAAPGVELLNPLPAFPQGDGAGTRLLFNFDPGEAASGYAAVQAVRQRVTQPEDTHLAFFTRQGGAMGERMRIDRGGDVGIGTTVTTGAQLTINAPSAPGLRLSGPAQSSVALRESGATRLTLAHDGSKGSLNSFGHLGLGAGGSERVRLDAGTGNVGIGTASPDAARSLDIVGSARATALEAGPGSPAAPSVRVGASLASGLFSPGADQFAFVTAGSTRVVADASSVAIGTTTAAGAALLVRGGDLVIGSPKPGTFINADPAKEDVLVEGSLITEGRIITNGAVSSVLARVGVSTQVADTEFFRVLKGSLTVAGDGKVGLGVTAPAETLHVEDPAGMPAPGFVLGHPDQPGLELRVAGAGRALLDVSPAGPTARLGTENATPLVLGANGASTLRAAPNGSVGINNAAPAVPLDVTGNVSVRGEVRLKNALPVGSGGTGGLTPVEAALPANLNAVFRDGTGSSLGAAWSIGINLNANTATSLAVALSSCPVAPDMTYPQGFDQYLHVLGCVSLSAAAGLNEATSDGYAYDAGNDLPTRGSNWSVQAAAPYNINFVGGTFFLDSLSQRLGIGTTTPGIVYGNKLEVAGIASASGRIYEQGGLGIPSGAIAYTDQASCPTGWSEVTELRGLYLIGLPAGGSANLTKSTGTALGNGENRALGQHNHTFAGAALAGHNHTFTASGAFGTHTHTFTGNPLAGHNHTFTGNALNHSHTFTGNSTSFNHGHGITDFGHTHQLMRTTPKPLDATTTPLDTPMRGNTTGVYSSTAFTGITITYDSGDFYTPAGTLNNVSAGTPAGTLANDAGATPTGSVNASLNDTPQGNLTAVSGGTPTGLLGNSGTTAGTNAPYIQLLACKRN